MGFDSRCLPLLATDVTGPDLLVTFKAYDPMDFFPVRQIILAKKGKNINSTFSFGEIGGCRVVIHI